MDNLEIVKEIVALKEQNISQDKQLKELQDDTKNLPKLEVLMEMVIKTNQDQVETNKELSQTLIEVKDNMHGLNVEMKNLSKDVGTLGSRVGDLEQGKKEVKKITTDLVMKVVGGIILAAALLALGLTKL